MLCELTIKNIALIEDLTLSFEEGFNVMTGETGAGKSIIIDAMNLITGSKTDKELITHGAQKASVEALVLLGENRDFLEKYGVEAEDELIISREISSNGRSVTRINGRMVNLTALRDIASHLINIHGQNQSHTMMDEKQHILLLDAYAGSVMDTPLKEMQEAYKEFTAIKRECEKLEMDERDRMQQIDMLTYQTAEIEKLKLKPGEEEELNEEKNVLENVERLAEKLSLAHQSLSGSNCALDCLSRAKSALEALALLGIDDKYQKLADQIGEAYFTAQDASYEVAALAEEIPNDPTRIDAVHSRLAKIREIERKYGSTIEEVLDFYDNACARLAILKDSAAERERLSQDLAKARKKAQSKAAKLSELRKLTAKKLEKILIEQLRDLSMKDAKFEILFSEKDLSPNGADKVEFYISVNKGVPPAPLSKVASGGEASRIMLALKSVTAGVENAGTLIFDEIDAGISGNTALVVGDKMSAIAGERQVICVTHLPQIAAQAGTHFFIEKHTKDGKTNTDVRRIEGEQLIREVARLSGGNITDAALAHAKELLKMN